MHRDSGGPVTTVSTHYQGDRGREYVARRQSNMHSPGYALDFQFFAPYIKSTDRVLDFGCGNGGVLQHVGKAASAVVGLEVNPAAAEIARNWGHPVYGRIEELRGEPQFDVIVSNHVLEHIRDVCATLDQLRGVLKPGGLLVVKLPIDDIRGGHQRGWSKDDVDHHLQTWTPRLFANVLFETGFDVRECRVVTHAYHGKLFPLMRFGLGPLAFWALAFVKNRRQLLAVAVNPK